MFLRDGMKGEFIFLLHTNIQTTQTDMQGIIGTPKRSEGHRHGNTCLPKHTFKNE